MRKILCKTEHSLQEILDKRKQEFLYRYLQVQEGLLDFCSNDYLSFARSIKIRDRIDDPKKPPNLLTGSTGSRSISGNTSFAEELEKEIAEFHGAESGLIFNSGYDANVGLFSSIAGKHDTIICDELIHASIIDGCRLGYAKRFKFEHNNIDDLEKKLQQASGNIFVAVESVYSMDGDIAPLREIACICTRYEANLIVDEAHATGVFGIQGRGLVNQYGLQETVFARIHTFGKALGCHGACVVGSETLRNYLINFARSFIFTTALPMHALLNIKHAYERLKQEDFDTSALHQLIQLFKTSFKVQNGVYLINSISPVQSIVIGGNQRTKAISKQLQKEGFDVRAILSPSVPVGKERLRISIHLHNTNEEVIALNKTISNILGS